jgi:hypothetical protein
MAVLLIPELVTQLPEKADHELYQPKPGRGCCRDKGRRSLGDSADEGRSGGLSLVGFSSGSLLRVLSTKRGPRLLGM